MPLFDFKCPVCEAVREEYVPNLHTEVFCEPCLLQAETEEDGCVWEDNYQMERQSFSSGSRATFDINSGYNANNGYGLRWPNNPSDLKLNPHI